MATAVNLSLPLTSPFHIADKAIMPPCFKVIQIILTCVCLTLKRDVEICFQRRSILEKTEYPFNNIQNIERNVAELLYLGCMNQFMIDYKLITWSLCKQNPEKIDHIHAASERYDFVINYLHLYQEFKESRMISNLQKIIDKVNYFLINFAVCHRKIQTQRRDNARICVCLADISSISTTMISPPWNL